jgi:nuclease S1
MHQPCHVGDNGDKGGNPTQVRFFDRGTNMHTPWDTGMIERVSESEEVWLADLAPLDTPEARQEAMKGAVEDWATESLLAAREAYKIPGTGKRLRNGQRIGDEYLTIHLPVAQRRLTQAGSRLAWLLNTLPGRE